MAMNKATAVLLLCIALGLTAFRSAQAFQLQFVPSVATFSTGDTVQVNIDLTGNPPTVAAYDLFVGYDALLLQPLDVTFGLALGDPLLAEALTASDVGTPGVFEIAEVSLLSAGDLATLQGPDFTLATLFFTAQADGSANFGLVGTANAIDGPNGEKLPEPTEVSLLALGLGCLFFLVRSRGRRKSSLGTSPS